MLVKFALGPRGSLGPGILLEVALGFVEAFLERLAALFILDDARLDIIEPDALGGDDLPQLQRVAAVGGGASRGRVGPPAAGGGPARASAA